MLLGHHYHHFRWSPHILDGIHLFFTTTTATTNPLYHYSHINYHHQSASPPYLLNKKPTNNFLWPSPGAHHNLIPTGGVLTCRRTHDDDESASEITLNRCHPTTNLPDILCFPVAPDVYFMYSVERHSVSTSE